jgi:pyruvate,orthophosphate dikinase
LNDETVQALAKDHGERFAYDSYRRFINMYGTVVLNIPHHYFEDILHEIKEKNNIKNVLTHSYSLTHSYLLTHSLTHSGLGFVTCSTVTVY